MMNYDQPRKLIRTVTSYSAASWSSLQPFHCCGKDLQKLFCRKVLDVVCDSSSSASMWRIELGLTQEIITETHPATTRRCDGFRNPGLEPARPSLGRGTSDQLGLGLYFLLLGGKFL
mmetsp:Transcript_52805/g.140972  ORF Transcript_52805/g.140972 Transcript_52805/m.140972 type:complete len:117 (+) Transcript_52805:86-436(+)